MIRRKMSPKPDCGWDIDDPVLFMLEVKKALIGGKVKVRNFHNLLEALYSDLPPLYPTIEELFRRELNGKKGEEIL